MGHYIGVDLGTTSITTLMLDTASRQVLAQETIANTAEITTAADRTHGRSEWDIACMAALTFECVAKLMAQTGEKQSVTGLGVTGQQHGMVLLNRDGQPCTPFIGWQDRRCHDRLPSGQSYLERMLEMGGERFSCSERPPARGYMGSTLFWLAHNGQLSSHTLASFAPDYLVSRLCEHLPVTDPTNAAGSGLFDVVERRWNSGLLDALGLDMAHLPEVHLACTWAGRISQSVAQQTALPSGLPVTVACGDNQASFAGSVADYDQSVLVNIGTGGQISAYLTQPIRIAGLLLRPFLQDGFLLVGAGLCGGRSYGVLQRFIQQVGEQVFGLSHMPDLYDRLNELAAAVPPGSDDLRCEPIFTGSLHEPHRRGVWTDISDTNLPPGHLTRSLLEGMAEQFRLFYQIMQQEGVSPRSRLIGAGNGVRKNPLLGHILAEAFRLPLGIVQHTEEAAVGAALCASVAAGEFPDMKTAGQQVIRYHEHQGET